MFPEQSDCPSRDPESGRAGRRARVSWCLLLAIFVGFAFRIGGLSHDLDDGYIYHPDSPKQMRAAERYLGGKYYIYTGYSDYDGYPLFHAHLIEWSVRAGATVGQAVSRLIGVPDADWSPTVDTLYWFARGLSVFLATLLIWIVFLIGRETASRDVGLVAAWFLALSPVDVASAHYETGDTTASFFAILTVLFAMRILNRGRLWDYVWAALAGMCAFGSKYHAGMALVAVGLAHLLRYRRWRDLFSFESIRAVVVLAVAGGIGFLIANPATFFQPIRVPKEIWAFLQHVSEGDRLPPEYRNANFFGRFGFSMRRHIPILLSVLSWPVCACVVAGLLRFLKFDRKAIILYSLPLVYFLLGVTLRPLAHPIYHTMMTPLLFVIAAWVLAAAPRLLSFPLMLLALAQLGVASVREDFFFLQRDTRRAAEQWTQENVPPSFFPNTPIYTFDMDEFGNPDAGPPGHLNAASSIRSKRAPDDFFEIKSFRWETDSLPFFRNPDIRITLGQGPAIREGFQMPIFERSPSLTGNEIIPVAGATFLRPDRMVEVAGGQRVERWLVSESDLPSVTLLMANGGLPNSVAIEFGGKSRRIELAAGERRVISLDHLRPSWRDKDGVFNFYAWKISTSLGAVRVEALLNDEERAARLFASDFFAEAVRSLASGDSIRSLNPSSAALLVLAAARAREPLSPRLAERLESRLKWVGELEDPSAIRRVWGIAPEYLQAIPFISWSAESLSPSGMVAAVVCDAGGATAMVRRAAADAWLALTPPAFLDPGLYTLSVRARAPKPGSAVVAVRAADDADLWTGAVQFVAGNDAAFAECRTTVALAKPVAGARMVIRGEGAVDIRAVSIRPDVAATLKSLADSIYVLRDEDPRYGTPEEFLRPYYPTRSGEVARASSPEDPAGDFLRFSTEAKFERGLSLRETLLSAVAPRAGETFRLRLIWNVDRPSPEINRWSTWIHVKNEKGETVFQGDRPLVTDMFGGIETHRQLSPLFSISIPAGTPPGKYEVRMGVYDPARQKRFKLKETTLKKAGRGVILPFELDIRP